MLLGTDDMVRVPLSQIARETGGRWIQHANDLETVLGSVVKQNTAAYVLAYESSASREPGRHAIRVTVRRKGVKVSSRRAYIVDPESASSAERAPGDVETALRSTIAGTVPQGPLGLSVHAAPQFAAAGQAHVLVTVAVEHATVEPGTSHIALQLLTVDQQGRVGHSQRLSLSPTPDGQEWEGSAVLPASEGRHQLRVAAATPDGRRTGLALQDIAVEAPGQSLRLGVPVLLKEDAAGVRPTLARAFPAGRPLAFQVEAAGTTRRSRPAGVLGRRERRRPADLHLHVADGHLHHVQAPGGAPAAPPGPCCCGTYGTDCCGGTGCCCACCCQPACADCC